MALFRLLFQRYASALLLSTALRQFIKATKKRFLFCIKSRPGFLLWKPGRFVYFMGAFSGAHAKPCEGSFGKPRVCGESATPWHSTPVLWDHPRVCGGKGHLTLAVSHMHRINPAYAGKRESRQQDHTITWDHPRVCGEKARTLIVQNEPQGSPPRMRGKD